MRFEEFTTTKLVIFIAIFCIPVLLFSQRESAYKVAKNSAFIENLKQNSLTYADKKKVRLLEPGNTGRQNLSNRKENTDQYYIVQKEFSTLKKEKPSFFKQDISCRGRNLTLAFARVEIFAPDFQVITSDGRVIYPDVNHTIFYRGMILGDPDSWATCMVSEDKIQYLITSGSGNYEIQSVSPYEMIGYYTDSATSDRDTHKCLEKDSPPFFRRKTSTGARTGNCLEVYLECDNYTHVQLGNNPVTTTNWINAIFLNVATVYALHDIPLLLREIKIWTNTDPYAAINDLGLFRNQFVATLQNNYNGKIAQLLTIRNLGGGIANGIGGFCNSYPAYPGPQCVSTGLSASNTSYPNYSYNTYLIAHEFGHVMGLRHTNACVWGNNLVQIDDCGNVHAANNLQTPEGSSCFNPSSPILPVGGGTIMSNCDQLIGTGINLSQGFGPIAGQAVYENFVYAGCTTGTACNSLPPVNDLCVDAINLSVSNTCKNFTFTNANATSTSGLSGFSCGNAGTTIRDVWFKVTVPSSGNVTIQTSQPTGGLDDVIINVYSGSCSGGLTSIGCDDNTGAGNHALISITGRTGGEVLFIRLVDNLSDQFGTFNICAFDISVSCHPDFTALVAFYNGTGGPSWINKTGWQNGAAGSDCNVCTWFGVSCNELSRVSTINLPSNNLIASAFPSSFTNLTYLSNLRLYNNKLSGPLPSIFTSFGFLHTLDLGGNLFTGPILSNLGTITTLKNLYLDRNLLTGSLPVSLTNLDLNLIYVNNNNLTGCIPASYSEFCGKSYNFSGNANLANGISFDDFCNNGNGSDTDADSYCKGGLDCDDTDSNIFPGATETCNLKDDNCNGLVDDVSSAVTNSWIAGSGSWNSSSNWSLGHIPARCENVIISGAPNITVTIPDGFIAYAWSIEVTPLKSLVIATTAELNINHGMNLINSGFVINNGTLTISNILSNSLFGINNNGSILNQASGRIVIQNSGQRSVSNNQGGVLTNNGILTIDRNAFNLNSTGIHNEGNIINNLTMYIRNIIGKDLVILPGAAFYNQANGFLSID